MVECLYTEEDRVDSSTRGLCLCTLLHTHHALHTAEIERFTMLTILNTLNTREGLFGRLRLDNTYFF